MRTGSLTLNILRATNSSCLGMQRKRASAKKKFLDFNTEIQSNGKEMYDERVVRRGQNVVLFVRPGQVAVEMQRSTVLQQPPVCDSGFRE